MNELTIRQAEARDLPDIIRLLSDDMIGQSREDASVPPNSLYTAAFEAITSDPNQYQAVAILNGNVVGTLQLSFIPGISRLGSWRGQIEGVRISTSQRGGGLGQKMFEWAIEKCRQKGCSLIQLTTDRDRPDAHRFYNKLGFVGSHIGYKMTLKGE